MLCYVLLHIFIYRMRIIYNNQQSYYIEILWFFCCSSFLSFVLVFLMDLICERHEHVHLWSSINYHYVVCSGLCLYLNSIWFWCGLRREVKGLITDKLGIEELFSTVVVTQQTLRCLSKFQNSGSIPFRFISFSSCML